MIESMDLLVHYRLNIQNNHDARQLMIDFKRESSSEEKEENSPKDLSLDLFL